LLIGALSVAVVGVAVAIWTARTRPTPVPATPLARLVAKKESRRFWISPAAT